MNNSLLPPNGSPLERALEQATRRAFEAPVPVSTVWDPDTCPAKLLPWLAWALGVDQWQSGWSEAQKRAVIRNAIYIHRYRGTLAAVKRALLSLGHTATVSEWFQESPKGQPGTFSIDVEISETGLEQSLYTQLEQVVNDAKNIRSHLAGVKLIGVTEAQLAMGVIVVFGNEVEIPPYSTVEMGSEGQLFLPAGIAVSVGITVFPG